MDIQDYIKEHVPHLLLDDPDTKYKCSEYIMSSNFSFLHKLVIETRKHKILEEYLKIYLQTEKGKKELDLKNSIGWTPLMLACRKSKTYSTFKTVKILIENGANLNLQTNNGNTALMMASGYSNTESTLETVKTLIENGANIDLQNNDGKTALMFACNYSNTYSSLETVKILVENGANLDLQDNEGWSALIIASRYSNTDSSFETVKILVKNGANLDLQNNNGNTALIMACDISNTASTYETVKILTENGANLDLQNNKGYTALMYLLNNNNMQYYLEYYKTLDKNILQKYITKNKIPINNYDLLVDSKIIPPILPEKYEKSKYHIKINIPLRILNSYETKISECMICSEDTKILICNYNHHTCFSCLHKLEYKCEFCKCFL